MTDQQQTEMPISIQLVRDAIEILREGVRVMDLMGRGEDARALQVAQINLTAAIENAGPSHV